MGEKQREGSEKDKGKELKINILWHLKRKREK